ncbi:MAG: tRNA (5-methylaminomethyl-2-thiouridine)(34)-methyltransferase MnmD [Oligoflexia bacterium]|nr:tRNA (5-methylaminomethyl-2-thiouridine)(34)-methyltransferase MnmD [Oligoflexia bacterium]
MPQSSFDEEELLLQLKSAFQSYNQKFQATSNFAELSFQDDKTLFSKSYNDIYYSVDGASTEKDWVFLKGNDLYSRWPLDYSNNFNYFNIMEIGFGTGLNFLLTKMLWNKSHTSMLENKTKVKLNYIGIEGHPINSDDLFKIYNSSNDHQQYANEFHKTYQQLLPLEMPAVSNYYFEKENISLTLLWGKIEEISEIIFANKVDKLLTEKIDSWYLDGFSPKCNLEMWSDNVFKMLQQFTKIGGTAATYSVSQIVKAQLIKSGFEIKKVPGPNKKKEILLGKKLSFMK